MTSLQKLGFVVEYDYVNMGRVFGPKRVNADLEAIMTTFRPQLVLTQVHMPAYVDVSTLAMMRRICPKTVIVNWNGDDFRPHAMANMNGAIDYMQAVDVNLITNGGLFEYITPKGVRAMYDFCAFEPVEPNPTIVGHDVVYLGNALRPATFEVLYGKNNFPRLEMEKALRAELKAVDVGFYGNSWAKSDGENIHDWSHQNALYARSKLAIVDNQYADAWGYTSDRLFKAMAYAQCVLWQGMDGAETLTGYMDGVHYVRWVDIPDLIAKIRELLADDERRLRIGRAAREFTREVHSYDARTRQLFDALKYLRADDV
jgi:glycosyltransferase involved in cell wall biosynthesis